MIFIAKLCVSICRDIIWWVLPRSLFRMNMFTAWAVLLCYDLLVLLHLSTFFFSGSKSSMHLCTAFSSSLESSLGPVVEMGTLCSWACLATFPIRYKITSNDCNAVSSQILNGKRYRNSRIWKTATLRLQRPKYLPPGWEVQPFFLNSREISIDFEGIWWCITVQDAIRLYISAELIHVTLHEGKTERQNLVLQIK